MSKVIFLETKYSLHSLLSLQLEGRDKDNVLEYQFWANLIEKIKIVILIWNLELSLS